jgi:hypothetical protein
MVPLSSESNDVQLYRAIIGIFCVISLGSVVLSVILVRSRHKFSVRPFHSGICIYIASFAPYALLKVVAVNRLLDTKTQEQQLTDGLLLNGTFMMFFCLGFGGKMALIQLWMHLISCHTSGKSEQSLMVSARKTWKLMRLTVLAVCILYSCGFMSLVGVFAQASNACVGASVVDPTFCIPLSQQGEAPSSCQQLVDIAQGISYYEGGFAAVVALVFTLYALMFNGLVYALLTSDSTFSNLTKMQRILISNKWLRWLMSPFVHACATPMLPAEHLTRHIRFIPPSWQPSAYQTMGELELWRSSLRTLGSELAVISVCSFACKPVLVFLSYFGILPDGSGLYLSLSTLLVEALPTLLTIVLLTRYHRSAFAARGDAAVSLGDISTSLLGSHAPSLDK